eukprot:1132744-Pelagomonas_calceolata.AAC.8
MQQLCINFAKYSEKPKAPWVLCWGIGGWSSFAGLDIPGPLVFIQQQAHACGFAMTDECKAALRMAKAWCPACMHAPKPLACHMADCLSQGLEFAIRLIIRRMADRLSHGRLLVTRLRVCHTADRSSQG